jgi:hypothetical protein
MGARWSPMDGESGISAISSTHSITIEPIPRRPNPDSWTPETFKTLLADRTQLRIRARCSSTANTSDVGHHSLH